MNENENILENENPNETEKPQYTEEEYLQELSMKTYDENGEEITKWDEELGWLELNDELELNKYGTYRMTQIYHPYTEKEIIQKQLEKEAAALAESRRQFTPEEATVFFMRSQVNAVNIPDQTSLRMMNYYPTFEESIGQKVKIGFKFTYKDEMYKTIQSDLIIQAHYPPGHGTESLYSRIDIEHTGAIYDPIPYDGNMELFEGMYYTQADVLYLCIRNSGQALYHALKDLVGNYVKVVDNDGNPESQEPVQPYEPTIQEFKQPTGAHDAYAKGDKVIYKGKKYISLIDANTYSPEAYPAGWQEVVE